MIAEIGLYALILALFVAAVQAVVPLMGAARGLPSWMKVARPAAVMQFALVGLALAALIWAHVTSDFSVLNVARHSSTSTPLLYKITGVWGNREGSMLLLIFVVALYGMAAAMGGKLPPRLRARTLAVQAMIAFGFILLVLLTSNPFTRLSPTPLEGAGLNPLLQDPALAIHPPLLFLGYVGFSLPFSFAVAALIEGRADAAWARLLRPWALIAWCALTLGIAAGSWWSYYTLGWGGWWAWDPVENASLMPWLTATALVHGVIVCEKRDRLRVWTVFLALVTFSLVLLGSFLVRSGVLTSIHAYASDPKRGILILTLLILAICGSLALFAVRAGRLAGGGTFAPVSRASGILFGNVLLAVATGTVLLGTLYPLFIEVLGVGKISVGPPYFNLVFAILLVPLILLMAAGPLLSWQQGDLREAVLRLKYAFAAALAAGAWLAYLTGGAFFAPLGLGLAVLLLVATLQSARGQPLHAYGRSIAHLGVAVLVAGMSVSSALESDKLLVMRPGDEVSLAGYALKLVKVENVAGANYRAERAQFVVMHDGRWVTAMSPERRRYDNPPMTKAEVAIRTNLVSDLYVVLGEAAGRGGHSVHVFYKPLMPFVFIGMGLMVLGGLVALGGRIRLRAPAKKASVAIPAAVQYFSPRLTFVLPLVAFAVLALFLIYRLGQADRGDTPDKLPSAMIGRLAPAFDLPPLYAGGKGLKTADLKGRVTLVNFFASWCAPCRAEHPVLRKAARAGMVIIGVDYKDKPADAKALLAELGDPYRTVGVDANGRTGIDFGVYGVPESYLIDRQGVIRFRLAGPLTEEILKRQLIPLAKELNR